ncbi:hypothetical protein PG994_000051 [Apiospora phragmitis]|uniref:CCHC-type domain-containing protein n=1 Tax=Apiospora phragmitis TaxID=2905665 RepID=A0ABR1X542_9PEZI
MADGTPGRPASSEPPCYNCGMRGHMFTACPEPTRELPAGLEASRARQHTSGSDRVKAQLLANTHYLLHRSSIRMGLITLLPYPPQLPPQYPPSYGQGYPPPPRPPYDGYNAPGTTGPPSGSHPSYGPPYGQPAPPHHGYGPPGVHPELGHPTDYRAGPPHPHSPAPGYPPPPAAYGFPGQPRVRPSGHLAFRSRRHMDTLYHLLRLSLFIIHLVMEAFRGIFRLRASLCTPLATPHHSMRNPIPHTQIGAVKTTAMSVMPSTNVEVVEEVAITIEIGNDMDMKETVLITNTHTIEITAAEETGMDQSVGIMTGTANSHRGVANSTRCHRADPRDSLHTSAQSTPGPSAILDHPQPSRQLEDATSNEKAPADATDGETKVATESDVRALPDVNTEDKLKPNTQAEDQSVEPQANPQVHLAHDIGPQPEEEDGDTPYEGFKYDEQTIFMEIETTNKGDPIAAPLPIEWTDDIMLPPPYNAPGVKSAYVTPENKDDFALGVRDTDQWAQYQYHIAFLDPENITIQSIDTYLAEVKRLQLKNEKRNKPSQQINQRAKPQSRDYHQGQRHHKDQHRRPDNRKRRFEDYQGEPEADSFGRDRPADLAKSNQDYDAKRPKQMSPEPGEVSDSNSVQGGIGGGRPVAEEKGWTGWTRGPVDILHRDFPLSGRQTPAKTPWYPDTDAHYQAQPPLRRYHTEGTLDGSYDSRNDSRTDSYTPRGHARDHDSHDRFRDGSEGRRESRGRSRSPGARRYFPDRQHSPESNIRHRDVSNSHADWTPDSKPRRRNESVVSSTGREGQAAPPSLPSSDRPSQRRSSPRPKAGRSSSRRSSVGNQSEPESPGSPLTPLEAELLGLAGHDSSDSDAGGKSPPRKPEKVVPKMRRRRAQIDAAYSISLVVDVFATNRYRISLRQHTLTHSFTQTNTYALVCSRPFNITHLPEMCFAVEYVYQCYSCHSTVIKDLHHGPRWPCDLVMTNDPGGGGGFPLLGCCPTGLVWTSQRRRCCDDIDPRAATNNGEDSDQYRYFLLRTEKVCLWCEIQNEIHELGIHAESEVLGATIPSPASAPAPTPTPSPTPSSSTLMKDSDDDDDEDKEGGAPL